MSNRYFNDLPLQLDQKNQARRHLYRIKNQVSSAIHSTKKVYSKLRLLLCIGSESEPISLNESMELIDHKKSSDIEPADNAPVNTILSQTIVDEDKDQKPTDDIQSIADERNSESKSEIEKKNE